MRCMTLKGKLRGLPRHFLVVWLVTCYRSHLEVGAGRPGLQKSRDLGLWRLIDRCELCWAVVYVSKL
jgi:hypothetical protein